MKSDDQKFKADAGKTNPALLEMGFPRALRLVQACLDYGAKKYEAHSWRDVPNAIERYTVAGRRHRQARDLDSDAKSGFHAILESCDIESGLPHIAHEVFNLLALIELEFKAHENTSAANDLLMRIISKMKEPPTAHKSNGNDAHVSFSCLNCMHVEVEESQHPCMSCVRIQGAGVDNYEAAR